MTSVFETRLAASAVFADRELVSQPFVKRRTQFPIYDLGAPRSEKPIPDPRCHIKNPQQFFSSTEFAYNGLAKK